MTKRVVSIICLLTVCLVGWARELKHDIPEDAGTSLTWKHQNYKIGYYNDSTVYTCTGTATFGSNNYQTYIFIPSGDSVIVSPARVRLTELKVYLIAAKPIAVSVSTDSVTWVSIENVGHLASNSTTDLVWDSIGGNNYYISIKNAGSGTAYIRKINYTLSDAPDPAETCNCFPVVFE